MPSPKKSVRKGRCKPLGRKLLKDEFYCLQCCKAVKSDFSKTSLVNGKRPVRVRKGTCPKGHKVSRIVA